MSASPDDAERWPRKLARVWTAPPLGVTLLVCAAVMYRRRPESWINPQFYAEDALFYARAWTQGGFTAIFEQCNGYLHLVPRLIAWLATQFDPAQAPALYAGFALALTLYVAVRTQSPRSPLPRHIGVALAVVLMPDAFEVLGTVVNIQWILCGGFVLLLLSADPERPGERVHDFLAAIVLGLTGPFSVVLLPLFIWRAVVRRSSSSVVLAAIIGICASVQAWLIVRHPFPGQPPPLAMDTLLAIPGLRIGSSLFLGPSVGSSSSPAAAVLLGLGVTVAVALLGIRAGPGRLGRIWLASAFGLLLVASLFRGRYALRDLMVVRFSGRYFFHLQFLFLWLVFMALANIRYGRTLLAAGVLAWVVAINGRGLRERPLPDFHWANYTERIRAGEAVTVPINPTGWTVSFPARPRPSDR